jgi:hypothetical protein
VAVPGKKMANCRKCTKQHLAVHRIDRLEFWKIFIQMGVISVYLNLNTWIVQGQANAEISEVKIVIVKN